MVLTQGASPVHSGSLRAEGVRVRAGGGQGRGMGSTPPKALPCLTRTSAHFPAPRCGGTTASTSLQLFLFRMEAKWPVHRTTREASAWSTHRGLLHHLHQFPQETWGTGVSNEQSSERRPNIRLIFLRRVVPTENAHTPVAPIPRVAQRGCSEEQCAGGRRGYRPPEGGETLIYPHQTGEEARGWSGHREIVPGGAHPGPKT